MKTFSTRKQLVHLGITERMSYVVNTVKLRTHSGIETNKNNSYATYDSIHI